MALTEYDKKKLSQEDQQKIQSATDKWTAANAKGDTAGMQSAAAEAAAIRNNAGYTTDTSGNYTGSYSPTSGGSTNSQYTGVGTHNDATLSAQSKNQINYYKDQYNKAIANGDTNGAIAAHLAAEAIREKYGYSGGVDGSGYIELPDNSFEYTEEKPVYDNKYDPQIDALLNEILNRDDFSYDVANDPLYQQYAKMYQREGERAMKDTMAEAAAGAGGMNTYAVTAAQQAYNNYNSQLNDKIPELYQLAYDMYLNDKESKVQDLGLLQNMDATQYNRYRDTISDYYNDKNFAYGVYRDDVADKQWGQTFDYNAFVDNRNYNTNEEWRNKEWDYNDYWKNKEWDYNDEWKNKEWDANQSQLELENSRYDTERADEKVLLAIEMGEMPSDEVLAQTDWDKTLVQRLVAAVQAEKAQKNLSGGSGKGGTKIDEGGGDEGDEGKIDDKDDDTQDTSDSIINNSVISLGLGPITKEYLLKLVETGRVIMDANGKVRWAEGYNKDNYLNGNLNISLPGFDWGL